MNLYEPKKVPGNVSRTLLAWQRKDKFRCNPNILQRPIASKTLPANVSVALLLFNVSGLVRITELIGFAVVIVAKRLSHLARIFVRVTQPLAGVCAAKVAESNGTNMA
jgi:hypothetical protein